MSFRSLMLGMVIVALGWVGVVPAAYGSAPSCPPGEPDCHGPRELLRSIEAAHRVFAREDGSIWWGGPVATVGFRSAEGRPSDMVVVGLGYEAASPSWVWYQAAVERDRESWQLSATTSATTPMSVIPMFLSLGAGGVFSTGSQGRQMGFRTHITFFLGGVLGVTNAVDIFLRGDQRVRHSLLFRVSI